MTRHDLSPTPSAVTRTHAFGAGTRLAGRGDPAGDHPRSRASGEHPDQARAADRLSEPCRSRWGTRRERAGWGSRTARTARTSTTHKPNDAGERSGAPKASPEGYPRPASHRRVTGGGPGERMTIAALAPWYARSDGSPAGSGAPFIMSWPAADSLGKAPQRMASMGSSGASGSSAGSARAILGRMPRGGGERPLRAPDPCGRVVGEAPLRG